MTIRYLTLAAGVAVVLATGVLHGVHTDRWKDGTDLDQAAERMKAVPLEFGDWQGQELTMEDDLRRAGIRGHLFRTYRHARTGKTVNLLLLMGRSGPISVHTPDVCYASAGYAGVGSPQKASVQAGPKPLPHWFLRVRKQNTEIPSELDVRWSWFNGERWDASDALRQELLPVQALPPPVARARTEGGQERPAAAVFRGIPADPGSDVTHGLFAPHAVGPPAYRSDRS
jgi:hypothetical protein